MSLGLFNDTIAAIATPVGKSALAIIRVSGPDAVSIVARSLRDPVAVWVARGGSHLYADVLSEARERIDDVVVSVSRAPRSSTGEDVCEISCHGSPLIARQILGRLTELGARSAEPGEFSRRAWIHGKVSTEEVELISLRIEASSSEALRGGEAALASKYRRLREVYDLLVGLVAQVDAEIDFGESDHLELSGFADQLERAVGVLNDLVHESANRRENAGYFTVSLIGPPNVGKSSLFNALLRYERSIVSDTPGTTRDYVESFLELEGFRVKLIDTAGIRESEEAIEREGIGRGQEVAQESDLALLITEPGHRSVLASPGMLIVHNKVDIDRWTEGVGVSALTGQGLGVLHSVLLERLRNAASEYSMVSLSEVERVTIENVVVGLEEVDLTADPVLVSEDLRSATARLAELLGLTLSEDSLHHIFSKMCIGK